MTTPGWIDAADRNTEAIQSRVRRDVLDNLRLQCAKRGLSQYAYIRLAVHAQLERDMKEEA